MKEKEITQEKLSKKSNISITTINQNLKLGRPFRVENIIEIAKVLNIAPTDISYYFFRIKVQKKLKVRNMEDLIYMLAKILLEERKEENEETKEK